MYQDIFAIDDVLFTERKKTQNQSPKYLLNNYNYYLPKLDKDFYLKYFMRELLIDLDIIEIDEFLDNQYINSKNQDQFIKVVTLKVIPTIDTIINNAQFSMSEGGYYEETKLEDGFIETEGVVKNEKYEYRKFYHIASLSKLQEDLLLRKKLISDYLARINTLQNNTNPKLLKWCGKPSHLAFIIRKLVDEGFITAPKGNNGEINATELSRQILESFSLTNETTLNTLRVYSNSDSDRFHDLNDNFVNQGFSLPNSALLG
ncbi:MAG: hypothetical protein GYB35_03855 [Algicola sp.]|nr:hypothetical protein [Algicola sp.]